MIFVQVFQVQEMIANHFVPFFHRPTVYQDFFLIRTYMVGQLAIFVLDV